MVYGPLPCAPLVSRESSSRPLGQTILSSINAYNASTYGVPRFRVKVPVLSSATVSKGPAPKVVFTLVAAPRYVSTFRFTRLALTGEPSVHVASLRRWNVSLFGATSHDIARYGSNLGLVGSCGSGPI